MKNKGFTLVELLVTFGLMALLVPSIMLVLSTFTSSYVKSTSSQLFFNSVDNVKRALQTDFASSTVTINSLTTTTISLTDGTNQMDYKFVNNAIYRRDGTNPYVELAKGIQNLTFAWVDQSTSSISVDIQNDQRKIDDKTLTFSPYYNGYNVVATQSPTVGQVQLNPNLVPDNNSIFSNSDLGTWNSFSYSGLASSQTFAATVTYNGVPSIKIAKAGLGDSGSKLLVTSLKPNTDYVASMIINIPVSGTSDGNGIITITNGSDALFTGAGYGTSAHAFIATNGWSQVSGIFHTGASDTSITFRITTGDIPIVYATQIKVYQL